MKARRKKMTAKEAARQRRLANLREPWKPGRSGNPKGRPPGSGSVVGWLKKRLAGPPLNGYSIQGTQKVRLRCLAQELAEKIVERVLKGDYNFTALLVDKTESKAVTEDQVNGLVDRFHGIVAKYVRDPVVLAKIAKDLHLAMEEDEDEQDS